MNLPQLKRTICTDLRRAVKLLPSTVIYTLIFFVVSLLVIQSGEKLFFHTGEYNNVSVGLYLPMESEGSAAGLALVENLQSFRESIDLVRYDTIEEGYDALSDRKVVALIVIPDDFVNSIYRGQNAPVRIIFHENNTLEEHIVNDLLLNSSEMLGTGQAASYALQDVSLAEGIDPVTAGELLTSVNSLLTSKVVAKDDFFKKEEFDLLSRHPLKYRLASCYTLFILCMMTFLLTPFYQSRKIPYVLRQHTAGLSRPGIGISEWISSAFLLYAAYLIIFTGLWIAGFGPKIWSLVTMIPVVIIIGLFIRLLSGLVQSPAYSTLIILIGTVLLLYISGGLIPMEFLPRFLQRLSSVNPVYGLICLVQDLMY